MGRFPGPVPALLVVGLAAGGLFVFSVAGSLFDFIPFFFGWMFPFLLVLVLAAFVRGVAGLFEARFRRTVDSERKERELLEALARHGEITPARAALETTLSVSEADRLLGELAKNGHIDVRVHDGRLGYALWEQDRRELAVK